MYYLFPLGHFLAHVNNNITSKLVHSENGSIPDIDRCIYPWENWIITVYGLWNCVIPPGICHSFMQYSFNKASLTSRIQWMEHTAFWCSLIISYYWCIHKNNAIDLPPIGHVLEAAFTTVHMGLLSLEKHPVQVVVIEYLNQKWIVIQLEANSTTSTLKP